jgi:hypothetical protein
MTAIDDKSNEPTPIYRPKDPDKARAELRALAEAHMAAEADYQRRMPEIRAAGVKALARLLKIAQGHSGQCKRVAAFLLGLYNGQRFPFDLTDFRGLDREIFEDCIALLRMDFTPEQEVHRYFENGGKIFEALVTTWGIPDRLAETSEHE